MTSMSLPQLPAPIHDDESLGQQITLLAGQINAATHRLLKLIAEFDSRGGWSGGGTVKSCAHWLNWKCGIAMGAAREKVRVAHCLDNLPLIDGAFAKGEISYSKVRAMTRVATPENEDFLLMIAQHGTASHLEQVVKKYKRVCASEQIKQEKSQQQERQLLYYQDEDGMWVIHAKLPPEEGSLVVKTLEAVTTNLRENVSAETPEKDDTVPNNRADALVAVAENFLATADESRDFKGLKGSERCQVVLHMNLDTLEGYLDNKHPVSAETAKRLSCDASLITVLEDNDGNFLNIGRRSRTVPPSISRALKLRDKTCRFPGCCQSRHVDAHHIKHWAEGGETSLDNLVTLCRFHHRQLHHGAFSISATIENNQQHLTFIAADGVKIKNDYYPQFDGVSAETFLDTIDELAPEVDEKTCVSKWEGERLDYGMAMDGLIARDREN